MNNALEMLTSLLSEEAKRSVFAAFSTFREADDANPHSYDAAVDKLRKNEIFVAAKAAGVDMKELKNLLILQYKKQCENLIRKLSKGYDLACDDTFLVIVKKEKDK